MNGFILVKKETGISSNRVVQKIKRKFNFSKVGHLGTLDPMASGLLIIAINRATKFSSYFLNETKSYQAEVALGSSSDTDDAEGKIIHISDIYPKSSDVIKALNSFLGISLQKPPFFSALKHKGKPLYKYARQGELISKPPREINIFDIKDINYKQPFISFYIKCSKGTYIRAIARDIGDILKCGGYLTKLIRTQQGCFNIEEAKNISDISIDHIIPISDAFPNLNSIKLDEFQTKNYINGGLIGIKKEIDEVVKIFSNKDKFLGLGLIKATGLKLKQLV